MWSAAEEVPLSCIKPCSCPVVVASHPPIHSSTHGRKRRCQPYTTVIQTSKQQPRSSMKLWCPKLVSFPRMLHPQLACWQCGLRLLTLQGRKRVAGAQAWCGRHGGWQRYSDGRLLTITLPAYAYAAFVVDVLYCSSLLHMLHTVALLLDRPIGL